MKIKASVFKSSTVFFCVVRNHSFSYMVCNMCSVRSKNAINRIAEFFIRHNKIKPNIPMENWKLGNFMVKKYKKSSLKAVYKNDIYRLSVAGY